MIHPNGPNFQDLPPEQCWRVAGPKIWLGDDGDFDHSGWILSKKPNGALVHLVSFIFLFEIYDSNLLF
jgi:hypothetical protein